MCKTSLLTFGIGQRVQSPAFPTDTACPASTAALLGSLSVGLWETSRDCPRLTHGADVSSYCFSHLPKSLLFLFLLPGQGGGHLLVGQLPQPLIAPLVSANSPTSPLCSKNDFSESQCSSSHDSPASSFRRFLLISSLSCLVYLGRSGAAFQT